MREEEREEVERRVGEVEDEERRVREELDEWKEGKREVTTLPAAKEAAIGGGVEEQPSHANDDAASAHPQQQSTTNLADLARELDALNKAIEATEREREEKAHEVVKGIEREMQLVEGELIRCVLPLCRRLPGLLAVDGYGAFH